MTIPPQTRMFSVRYFDAGQWVDQEFSSDELAPCSLRVLTGTSLGRGQLVERWCAFYGRAERKRAVGWAAAGFPLRNVLVPRDWIDEARKCITSYGGKLNLKT